MARETHGTGMTSDEARAALERRLERQRAEDAAKEKK